MERADDGNYDVKLQDFYLPHLKINSYYRTLAAEVKDRDTETYLKDRLKEAEGLIDGINYRRTTLYKVACCIVELQVDFLNEGYDRIRPLTMAQVAEMVEVSESTVSRVCSGNYVQTPRGVFELRFFFHSAVNSSSDMVVSSVSAKRRISALISAENPSSPLSDQAISDVLAEEGVCISRRTVAKYREELNIPARAARRRG